MIVQKTVKVEMAKAIKELDLQDFAKAIGASLTPIDVIWVEASVEIEANEFDDDDIEREYAKRFNPADESDVIGDIYQYLAAGLVDEAMDLMQREFGLPPVEHEKKTRRSHRARSRQGSLPC